MKEARWLATTPQQAFLKLIRERSPGLLGATGREAGLESV